ncbi:MAG: hypothetical protein A2X84_09640 [Desulfuromonadaceae bacterium GWC2_58_13]|nr:MAG: hypothetical protein A2X84_09640 [Desulfuromonadaceae bacterium GWC2_58_13]
MMAHPFRPGLVGWLLLCFLVFNACAGRCEPSNGTRLGGHLKSLNLYLDNPPAGKGKAGEISSDSLRLDLSTPATESVTFEFSIESKMLYADPASGLALPGDSPNRRLDLEHNWNEGSWLSQQLAVDRLNLHGSHLGVDWSLGRQAIGFGRISLFSPLDIIAPFPPDALDTEVRPGVDALRASHYFGLAGQASAALIVGQRRELNSYLVFGGGNIAGIDLLTIAGQLRERPMAGGGFATQLGGMGIKGEVACYQGQRVDRSGGDLRKQFAIAGTEIDYRFDNGLILFAQYLYNGAGVDDPEEYPRAATSAPIREGLSYLLGRHYLMIAPAYELHPLVTLNGLVIRNLRDGSFLLRPLLHISLSDNLALDLFWSFAQGTKPRRAAFWPGIAVPRSEFGTAADSGGLFLKYFF